MEPLRSASFPASVSTTALSIIRMASLRICRGCNPPPGSGGQIVAPSGSDLVGGRPSAAATPWNRSVAAASDTTTMPRCRDQPQVGSAVLRGRLHAPLQRARAGEGAQRATGRREELDLLDDAV